MITVDFLHQVAILLTECATQLNVKVVNFALCIYSEPDNKRFIHNGVSACMSMPVRVCVGLDETLREILFEMCL